MLHRPILTAALLLALAGCNVAGPAALESGRSTYNTVINRTEDEQLLAMVVRHRYDETFAMLAVASVTANIQVGASIGGNAGIGSSADYAGNLVPLSAGLTYEENPTISYVPLRGGEFVARMLSPIDLDEALLLSRASTRDLEVLRLLVRRANGLDNMVYAGAGGDVGFDRVMALLGELRDAGVLDLVQSGEGAYSLFLHDYAPEYLDRAREFLEILRQDSIATMPGEILLPLRFAVGAPRRDGLDLETPSVLEVLRAAGRGVAVPPEHLAQGIVEPVDPAGSTTSDFLIIHASRSRPATAMVAVPHRGWWFYVDARDAHSKQAFALLRALVDMRLNSDASSQQAPVLTLPVS